MASADDGGVMMKASAAMILMAVLMLPALAAAEVFVLAPTAGSAFVAGEFSVVEITFDVTNLASERNIQIDEAILEWEIQSIETGDRFEFHARENSSALLSSRESGTLESSLVSGGSADCWEFEAADFAKLRRGVVRLDLTRLVRGWISLGRINEGVLVYSKDIPVEELRSRLTGPRLTIRFGKRSG